MSLDDIQFPALVIQDFFKKNLVDLTSSEKFPVSVQHEKGGLNFFGDNKQQVLLLVNHSGIAFATDQQLTLLSGILRACKLTFEDIGLLNTDTYPAINYKLLSETFNPRIILLFGIKPEEIQLPFVMPEFQRQSYNNQVYLTIPSLDALEYNKDLKRKLWSVIQQIFSF